MKFGFKAVLCISPAPMSHIPAISGYLLYCKAAKTRDTGVPFNSGTTFSAHAQILYTFLHLIATSYNVTNRKRSVEKIATSQSGLDWSLHLPDAEIMFHVCANNNKKRAKFLMLFPPNSILRD